MKIHYSCRFLLFICIWASFVVCAIDIPSLSAKPSVSESTPYQSHDISVIEGVKLKTQNGATISFFNINIPPKFSKIAKEFIETKLSTAQGLSVKHPSFNRYREQIGMIYIDELWLQQLLLEQGLAFASPTSNLPFEPLNSMLRAERKARQKQAGLWENKQNYLTDAQNIAKLKTLQNQYHIVEGTITNAATIKGKTYINFGDDWRQDFTVLIDDYTIRKQLSKQGIEIANLAGKSASIRGWIEFYNGPMITLKHAQAFELLK